MPVRVEACNLCGCPDFEPLATRSDGVSVIRCVRCGHGTCAFLPDNPEAFYGGDYYSSDQDVGYSDYSLMAEHGVAWAAALIRLLQNGGRLLDIGCADGHLLAKLCDTFQCSGMEMNAQMAELCRRRGFPVIGADLQAPELLEKYRGSFDAVCAIAVFEHIVDFRGAVRVALDLLRPGGVLLFEVPLISASHPSDIWFRSSLEHIHYPTDEGLRRLFEESLQLRLVGGECVLKDYGSTYVGMVRNDATRWAEDEQLFLRVLWGPVSALKSKEERKARCLFELIHSAQSNCEVLPLLAELDSVDLTPMLVRRMAQIWQVDLARLASRIDEAKAARRRAEIAEFAVRDWELEIERISHDAEILVNSWSWRVTGPLRSLGALWNRYGRGILPHRDRDSK
jgi:SAM-dependent methyltransferase